MELKLKGMNRRGWLTFILIVVSVVIARLLAHVFLPSIDSYQVAVSAIVEAGLFPAAYTLYSCITYGLLGIVFILIQDRLPGTRLMKGLTFGILFGAMWAVYLLEPVPCSEGSMLISNLIVTLADGMAIVLLGALLGRFFATDSPRREKVRMSDGIVAMTAIPVLFLASRYLEFNVIHIYSSYAHMPLYTMLWAAAAGLSLGAMYLLLRPGLAGRSRVGRAAFFGIVIVGIDLLLFNGYIPLMFEAEIWELGALSFADIFARTAMDVISVTAGAYVCETICSDVSGSDKTGNRSNDGLPLP